MGKGGPCIMMVLFTSRSEKKALLTVRRILDQFADRIGNDTWQTIMTEEGVQEVKTLLRRSATKSTAVSCRWIRSRNRSQLLWVVGNRDKFNEDGMVPVNTTQKNILHKEWEAVGHICHCSRHWYLSQRFFMTGGNHRITSKKSCGRRRWKKTLTVTSGFPVSCWQL